MTGQITFAKDGCDAISTFPEEIESGSCANNVSVSGHCSAGALYGGPCEDAANAAYELAQAECDAVLAAAQAEYQQRSDAYTDAIDDAYDDFMAIYNPALAALHGAELGIAEALAAAVLAIGVLEFECFVACGFVSPFIEACIAWAQVEVASANQAAGAALLVALLAFEAVVIPAGLICMARQEIAYLTLWVPLDNEHILENAQQVHDECSNNASAALQLDLEACLNEGGDGGEGG